MTTAFDPPAGAPPVSPGDARGADAPGEADAPGAAGMAGMARMAPAEPPFSAEVQSWLDRVMPPGVPPLALFATMARDPRLFQRLMAGGLLDRGHLTLRQRELVIGRITGRCGCEYEWGVHVSLFGERIKLTEAERAALVHGAAADPCWSPGEQTLLELCDSLDQRCQLPDELWQRGRQLVGELGVLEVCMLAGFYRTISYLVAAMRLPAEPFAARFPPAG